MQPPPTGSPLFASPRASQTADSSSPAPSGTQHSSPYPIPGPSCPTNLLGVCTPPHLPPKRKEHPEPDPLDSPTPLGHLPKRPKLSLTNREKLDKIFDLLKHDLDWTIGDFLHHTFTHKDADNTRIPHSPRHGNIVQHFLSGRTALSVGELIRSWLTSPYGRGVSEDELFNVDTPYWEIKPVREALTAFAAQATSDRLAKEARIAVEQASGLRAHRTLETVQSLGFHFMKIIAEPAPKGVITARKSRPRDNVVAHCLSMLDFCKNDEARLLPLARGILYLSSLVPADIIAYNSRIAGMPAVSTIKTALRKFSDQKAVAIRRRGRDVTTWVGPDGRLHTNALALVFDNVQHFMRQRDLRIGRENRMIIGIACTFFTFEVDLAALDILDKRNRIATSRRAQITVEELLNMIDQAHLKQIGILQFLEALSNYIPEAAVYKSEIYLRYRTRVSKLQAPVIKYNISPLATSGKNEASIPELKDAFLDFLEQIGQTEDNFDSQFIFAGGDGMSYNNTHLLKKYLQNHSPDAFRSFEILRPVLQLWHTMWTDLCRIFETHWGAPLSDNIATLGHSAKKIGRAPPANLKKVDYYPSAQLLNLVHDMRMLDCWAIHFGTTDIFEYFAALGRLDKLPSFEDLEIAAKRLFETYVGSAARYQAGMDARDDATEWAARAPLGTPWNPTPTSSSQPTKSKRKPPKITSKKNPPKSTKVKKVPAPPPAFHGDQALFDTGTFMYDAMISREAAAAAAHGDVGRVWEAMKSMAITFAGSTHSKYTNYLLEMICDLELESNEYLKEATLLSTILNPDGTEGTFKPCDIYQEFLNRCIDPLVQRKDADYGAFQMRNVWSRNIKDIYDLKKDFRQELELSKRSGRHKQPHERPEVKILLQTYSTTELHKRRPGRTYEDGRNVNDFERGTTNLRSGALSKWATKTSKCRITHLHSDGTSLHQDSEHESDWSDDSEDDETPPMTAGEIVYTDGELVVNLDDDEEDFPAMLATWGSESDVDSD
ncbi:hypothetical protein B0H12DRAFT_1036342 [Mycena haematopus]|nr:hypothetical protein B0H12DRAFT_1036342 [Mycena haematopus]